MFGRKITGVNEIDLEFYYSVKEPEVNKYEMADMYQDPHFVFIEQQIYIEPNLVSENLVINKFDVYDSDKQIDFEIIEGILPKAEIREDIIIPKSDIKNQELSLNYEFEEEEMNLHITLTAIRMIEASSIKINEITTGFTIKEKSVEKVASRMPQKILKRNIAKEYILQLAKETAEEQKVAITDLSISGFYRDVPTGEKVSYLWKDRKLYCYVEGPVKFYFDAVGFYIQKREDRILKFIKR